MIQCMCPNEKKAGTLREGAEGYEAGEKWVVIERLGCLKERGWDCKRELRDR